MPPPPQTWTYSLDSTLYLISTDISLISRAFVIAAFAAPETYWAGPATPEQLDLLLEHSCVFGLYIQHLADDDSRDNPRLEQIGMARLVTDYVTSAYLTVPSSLSPVSVEDAN